jgi:gas vesicle protein
MDRNDASENEPYVVIEQRPTDVVPFLLGAALGAALALLLAPRSGAETRAVLGRRARAARETAEGVAERVGDSFADARDEVERRIESARAAVSRRTRQLGDAVAAGRSAAREAQRDLRSQLAKPPAETASKTSARSDPPHNPSATEDAPVRRRRPRGER